MTCAPSPDLGLLVGGLVVEDGMDDLASPYLARNGVEEADECLVVVPLHVMPDHPAVEDVDGSEQRRCAVSLAVVGHGAAFARLQRAAAVADNSGQSCAVLGSYNHASFLSHNHGKARLTKNVNLMNASAQ